MDRIDHNRRVAENLIKARGNRSQADVAMAVGVCQSSIANYEAGIRIPSDEIKIRLAHYFGMSLIDLFFPELED